MGVGWVWGGCGVGVGKGTGGGVRSIMLKVQDLHLKSEHKNIINITDHIEMNVDSIDLNECCSHTCTIHVCSTYKCSSNVTVSVCYCAFLTCT